LRLGPIPSDPGTNPGSRQNPGFFTSLYRGASSDTCSPLRLRYFLHAIGCIPYEYEYYIRKQRNPWDRAGIVQRIFDSVPARLLRQRTSPEGRERVFKDYAAEPVPQVWFKLFSDNRKAKCEDPRDKIFGLHSLTCLCCQREISIDYSLSWEEVVRNLLRHQVYGHAIAPKSLFKGNWTFYSRFPAAQEFQQMYRDAANMYRRGGQTSSSARLSTATVDEFCERIEDVEPFNVTFRGYVRGRIYYTSPPLSVLNLSEGKVRFHASPRQLKYN
jgi:hypothetical protein